MPSDEIDKLIIEIFDLNNNQNENIPHCEWFNEKLKQMESIGLNNFEIHFDDFVLPKIPKYKPHFTAININNFYIIEINGLYPKAMLSSWPTSELWSHTGVFYILQNYRHLKRLMTPKWNALKLFVNMIYGALLNGDRYNLKVKDIDPFQQIEKASLTIILNMLDLQEIKDCVVCIDVDEILIAGNAKKFKINTDVLYGDSIEKITDIRRLNRICRKFKIDITLGN